MTTPIAQPEQTANTLELFFKYPDVPPISPMVTGLYPQQRAPIIPTSAPLTAPEFKAVQSVIMTVQTMAGENPTIENPDIPETRTQ